MLLLSSSSSPLHYVAVITCVIALLSIHAAALTWLAAKSTAPFLPESNAQMPWQTTAISVCSAPQTASTICSVQNFLLSLAVCCMLYACLSLIQTVCYVLCCSEVLFIVVRCTPAHAFPTQMGQEQCAVV